MEDDRPSQPGDCASAGPSQSPAKAFEARYVADRAAGAAGSLSEYLRCWPDDKDTIVQRYLELECGHVAALHAVYRGRTSPGVADGETVGHYRIERELGRGGQGIVYLARDSRLNRNVALKVLRDSGLATREALLRFRREAEAASRLNHPAICTVYDVGVDGTASYIAMRYVEGRSLSDEIARSRTKPDGGSTTASSFAVELDGAERTPTRELGPDPVASPTSRAQIDRILALIETCARALHEAHEAGVIHRDIKPGNIMITPEGDPVILDFGLARADHSDLATLTQTGELFGTPAYMSPEQFTAPTSGLDRRTDIWSLGVTLYEALTHKRPFDGPTRDALYRRILETEPDDPRRRNPLVGRDLAAVVMTALTKDCDHRYQTALALAEDLRRVRQTQPVSVRPAGPWLKLRRWSQRNPALAIALAVLACVLSAGLVTTLILNARARDNLAGYNRLGRVGQLDELLREANDELWPVTSETIPALEAWLSRAQDLVSALPELERSLDDLRHDAVPVSLSDRAADTAVAERGELLGRIERDCDRRLAALEASELTKPQRERLEARRAEAVRQRIALRSDAAVRFRFGDDRDGSQAFRHDTLDRLVTRLRAFVSDDPTGTTIGNVERRLAYAREVRQRSLGGDAALAWNAARARILGTYGADDVLPPIEGLVPLGPDPDTEREEFAALQTGTVPVRGVDGRIKMGDESAIVMVLIPGGNAVIGSQTDGAAGAGKTGARASAPVHSVRLDPFLISKFEMTQGQWLRATGANPSFYPPGNARGFTATLTHPVERVSWYDADRVLRRLGMALPTEVQWEYAARAGTVSTWWTGDDLSTLVGKENLADLSFARAANRMRILGLGNAYLPVDDGFPIHAPVGSFAPNPFGLFDVVGNVAEWCRDAQGSYADDPAREGDGLRATVETAHRMIRGGAFDSQGQSGASAARSNHMKEPGWSPEFVGLRPAWLIRTPPDRR